ncbi:MAG: hypothetical protein CGW95_13685 [Phenylobacterium zucineum]|nr:MAG: hypothetical protein CGW95_13685 [Phenylobacterium zucineum]
MTASILLATAVTWGRFNPIQSAIPIFDHRQNIVTDTLRAYARANPLGWAVEARHYGAAVNGAGVPAINHVLLQPQLAFFRKAYPQMDQSSFDQVFNRYAHIVPSMSWTPTVPQPDVISLPADPFAIPLRVDVDAGSKAPNAGGAVERVETQTLENGRLGVSIEGWGRWSGVSPGQALEVHLTSQARGHIERATAFRLARPDLVAVSGDHTAYASGFGLRLEIQTPPGGFGPFDRRDLQIVTLDPAVGRYELK